MSTQALRTGRARAATICALAALLGTGTLAGQSALASGRGAHHHRRHARSASGTGGTGAELAVAAVERLVQGGTINQHQADAIDRQIDSGSVDGTELVQRGVVSQAQMTAVENALTEVKLSLHHGPGPVKHR